MIYKICEYCGAALDPGERCDCDGAEEEKRTAYYDEYEDEYEYRQEYSK